MAAAADRPVAEGNGVVQEQVVGVAHAGHLVHADQGDDDGDGRQEALAQHPVEKAVTASESHARQGIGGEHGDDDGERGRAYGDDDRIDDGLARIIGAGAADAEGRAAFNGDRGSRPAEQHDGVIDERRDEIEDDDLVLVEDRIHRLDRCQCPPEQRKHENGDGQDGGDVAQGAFGE